MIRVDTVRELFDVGRVLAGQPLPDGPRVAVLTNSAQPGHRWPSTACGPAGSEAAELVGRHPRRARATSCRPTSIVGNPLDLTYRSVPADYRVALRDRAGRPGRRRRAGHLHAAARQRPPRRGRHDRRGGRGRGQARPGRHARAWTTGRCGPVARCRPSPSPSRPWRPSGGSSATPAWRARPEGVVPALDGHRRRRGPGDRRPRPRGAARRHAAAAGGGRASSSAPTASRSRRRRAVTSVEAARWRRPTSSATRSR